MTQKSIKRFINEIYSKPPKKNYPTNKTDVNYLDDILSLDIIDLEDNGPENNRGYRYVLVVFDNFSNVGWTIGLKNKNAETVKDSYKNIIISSKRSPSVLERDRDRGFYNSFSQSFLNNNYIKLYSRNRFFGSVFAERFNRTVRDIPKRPAFQKGDGNWIDVIRVIAKQYNGREHISTKLTPRQASLQKNEGFAYKNLLDKQKRVEQTFQVNDLVTTTRIKKLF